jgi:hypothetical protein
MRLSDSGRFTTLYSNAVKTLRKVIQREIQGLTRLIGAKLETELSKGVLVEMRCRGTKTRPTVKIFFAFFKPKVSRFSGRSQAAPDAEVPVRRRALGTVGTEFSVRHIHGSARSALACSSRFNSNTHNIYMYNNKNRCSDAASRAAGPLALNGLG